MCAEDLCNVQSIDIRTDSDIKIVEIHESKNFAEYEAKNPLNKSLFHISILPSPSFWIISFSFNKLSTFYPF